MRLAALLAAAMLASSSVADAAKTRSRRSARRKSRPKKEAQVLPAQVPQPRIEPASTGLAAAAGFLFESEGQPLVIGGVLQESAAEGLGARAGDGLISVNGHETRSVVDVEKALASWEAGSRLGAVVHRAGGRVLLSSSLPAPVVPQAREPLALNPRESKLRDTYLAEPMAPPRLAADGFRVPAGAILWVRFPKGIPARARQGDILEGETSTPMALDPDLDFLAVPPGSPVAARVAAASDDGPVRILRLRFFKLRLPGGGTYPLSGMLADVAGNRALTRVSPGGSLVCAPVEAFLLAGPERDFKVRLLEPLTLFEPEGFFRAGPGLWIGTVGEGRDLAFEVSHVISQRSAERAGLKAGDRVHSIDDVPARKLAFSEAVGRLYGRSGTKVELRVQRSGAKRIDRVSLARGVRYRRGLGLRVRLVEGVPTAREVIPGSPAAKAGVKPGSRLLKAGGTALAGLSLREVDKALDGEALTLEVQGPEEAVRSVQLSRGPYEVALNAGERLEQVPVP